MQNVEESASWNAITKRARRIARWRRKRRVERFDILVAMALLLLLIFGWAVDVAPMERWWGGHLLTANRSPHA
jgi:hypothetical protein